MILREEEHQKINISDFFKNSLNFANKTYKENTLFSSIITLKRYNQPIGKKILTRVNLMDKSLFDYQIKKLDLYSNFLIENSQIEKKYKNVYY